MVQPSFVQSAYRKRDDEQLRKISYRQTKMRYVVLVVACLVVFGCEYCFDNPSALQTEIERNYKLGNDETMGEAQFNLLYSLYSFPNVIIPLIGGVLIDRIGARIVLILTAAICVVGQAVFGMGAFINLFTVMLLGRAVFGVGGEVLHAAQNTLISNWFKASELSMALGICISFPKLGSSLNAYVSPLIGKAVRKPNEYLNVAIPILIGFCIMIFSLFLAFGLAYIDRKSQKKEKMLHQSSILSGKEKPRSKIGGSRIKRPSSTSNISVRLIEQSRIDENEPHGVEEGQHISFGDIKKLPVTFWLLIMVAMLTETLFIPFLDNGNKYYQFVFKNIESADEAGIYMILPYVISSLLVPFMGYAVDKVGRRSDVLIGSVAFFVLTYGFMLAVETSVYLREAEWARWVPVILLGICVAIFCSVVVPTIPMLVSNKLLGTGFGIMEMIQNLGIGAFPIIAGAIRQTKETEIEGFHRQTLFFFVVSCLCLSIAILLKTVDARKGEKLAQHNFRNTYIRLVLKEDDQ